MTSTTLKTTPELREGDVVVTHGGMRVLIDSEPRLSRTHPGNRTFWQRGLVLNRDEVAGVVVPLGWTYEMDGTHRWTIQGNDLAHWHVEV